MRFAFLFFIIAPLLCTAQLNKKYIPKNTIPLNDSTFIGQTEITNAMYREFVHFVQDSTFTVLLYDSLPFDRAKYFLDDVPENRLKNFKPENRSEYAKIYGLDYDHYITVLDWDSTVIAVTKNLFYPRGDKFYYRREVDVRKLNYTLSSGELVAVYPDTISWTNDYYVKYSSLDSSELVYNMGQDFTRYYFWHPGYDNYPVVGLNQMQILAYCEWYAKQLNANSKNPKISYSVAIPTVSDYVAALKLCVPAEIRENIGPENAFSTITYNRYENAALKHVHQAYLGRKPARESRNAEDFIMDEWIKTNSTSPILNLLGGPAEVVQNSREPDFMTVLGGDYYLGLVDPNGIQANTLFYQRLFYKNQGYSFVSFRVIITVTHKVSD